MSQVQDFISMAFLLTALIAFNPWFYFSAGYYSPHFLGESYFNSKNYAIKKSERRELDYLCYLGADEQRK
jgi:ATP-binding cassette subfamily B protein